VRPQDPDPHHLQRGDLGREGRGRSIRPTDTAEHVADEQAGRDRRAEPLGQVANTVAKWEDGARPRARWLPLLGDVLGVDPAQLEADLAAWSPPPRPGRRRRVDAPKEP
jgi:hypothetical protein